MSMMSWRSHVDWVEPYVMCPRLNILILCTRQMPARRCARSSTVNCGPQSQLERSAQCACCSKRWAGSVRLLSIWHQLVPIRCSSCECNLNVVWDIINYLSIPFPVPVSRATRALHSDYWTPVPTDVRMPSQSTRRSMLPYTMVTMALLS